MKKTLVLLLLLFGCHAAMPTKYTPTSEIQIYTDLKQIPKSYFELGVVEFESTDLTRMDIMQVVVEKAKACGAHGLINIDYVYHEKSREKNTIADDFETWYHDKRVYIVYATRVKATMIRFY